MKSFAATLLASQVAGLYWVENRYTLIGDGNPVNIGAAESRTAEDPVGVKMELSVTHWQNESNDYMVQMCTLFDVEMDTLSNSHFQFYWGVNFRPESPVRESNWDGIRWNMIVPTVQADLDRHKPTGRDVWLNWDRDTVLDTNFYGAADETHLTLDTTTRDWTLNPDLSGVKCTGPIDNMGSCQWTGCAFRPFKTQDA